MNDNMPQYEHEAWLLPYKPLDRNKETSEVQKDLRPNFETNKAGKQHNEVRDSKNRIILSKEALFKNQSGIWPDDISGLKNVPNLNSDQISTRNPSPDRSPVATSIPASHKNLVSSSIFVGSSTAASSSIPVYTNIPGSNTIPGHNPFLEPRFVQTTNANPSMNTSSDAIKKNKEKQMVRRQVKLNPLQRKLKKALATPVSTSKAESMMLKMGWSGGALGKTGGGIIEPIAPNLVYATSTKGFGQAPPSPKPQKAPTKSAIPARQPKNFKQKVKLDKVERKRIKTEKHQQRSQMNKLFKQNVMGYILEFVRNEREIAIIFDKELHNGHRKIIHRIVEEIRKLGETGDQSQMNEGFDRLLLLDIAKNNRYVLRTQSEGEHPFRYLCLFKEAPESMYLVTHFKLNDKENYFYVKEETVQHRTSRKKRKERRTEKWFARNERNLPDAKCSVDKEYKIDKDLLDTHTGRKTEDIKEDHDQVEKDSGSQSEKNCGSEYDNNCESEVDQDCESENGINKPDEVVSANDTETINCLVTETTNSIKQINDTIDIEDEIMEIVERTASGACRITKIDEVLETGQEIDKNPLQNGDFKINELVIENNNESINGEEATKPKDIKDKVKQTINELIPNDDTPVNISILTSSRKEFMRYNLNMCFSDFITNNVFKEFKFLGDFDIEEFEVLNEFLKDFFLVKNGNLALDEEFMGIWSKTKCKLAFKRDLNGGIVIYKVS